MSEKETIYNIEYFEDLHAIAMIRSKLGGLTAKNRVRVLTYLLTDEEINEEKRSTRSCMREGERE